MTLHVWPPVSPEELVIKKAETLARELDWIIDETISICHELKHGIEDCYALLAPIDPGSTLVLSTHRNERVKGTITRVGTRIVKGTINIQLRTLQQQTITISPSEPIHLHALDSLHEHLTQSIDLLGLTLSADKPPNATSLASTLAVLAESLTESAALLKGREADHPEWTTSSCPSHHFNPPLPPDLSFYLALQESCVVLWLRALESQGAPLNFGMKLGLAIGTVRRLEHDEMDTLFNYYPLGDGTCEPKLAGRGRGDSPTGTPEEVFVREKLRVESADPSLISLYSKLGYLSHLLDQARHNLAAVMGVDLDS